MNTDQQSKTLSGLNRFTDNAKRAVVRAHELAAEYRNPAVETIHLFIALIENNSGIAVKIFERMGLDVETTKQRLQEELVLFQGASTHEPLFSDSLKKAINAGFIVAERLSHVYVGSEHLLIAMLETSTEQPFVRELIDLGMTPEAVTNIVSDLGTYPQGLLSQPGNAVDPFERNALPFFCKDMNEAAQNGEYLNITGRNDEIERIIHILSRKTKNNPILVGDAGVGKTAVIQGLAQRIIKNQVPGSFVGMQLLSLDVSSIIAGARVRGDVEERILSLVNDAIESGNKIIFIDEIHMIVGAGANGGKDPMDIGNILKPYLTDPNLRIIGATTTAEYRRYFDDDAALSRRFQPVEIAELDKKSAVKIIEALKADFEAYHGVKIKPEAITEAVDLSAKFITERFLPDKAIDLIDEAAASVKVGREIEIEPRLSELGEKLMQLQSKKDNALLDNRFDAASKYKLEEESVEDEIADLIEGRHKSVSKFKDVNADLIRKIVVDWTKIPLAAAKLGDDKLKDLQQRIQKKIVGQNQVVDVVVQAIKRSHMGLIDSNRPLASFLFLGPTGVGKTELAKTIAKEVFGSDSLLVQLNMSEYMEMHSVAKMIGSPPGYVGFQEGGQLTEQIRRRPYSVVLFDEIEKAHPDVLNLLLQILDEGQLKDGKGRAAVFKNTVVILTSNIGAEEVAKDNKLGFDIQVESEDVDEMEKAYEEMRDSLLESLKEEVRPELLNRLDGIAVFRGLNEKDCLEISQLMVNDLVIRMLDKGIALKIAPAVIKMINKGGYSKEYGARNLRRKMQELLENGLADFLLEHKPARRKNKLVRVEVKTSGDKLQFAYGKD